MHLQWMLENFFLWCYSFIDFYLLVILFQAASKTGEELEALKLKVSEKMAMETSSFYAASRMWSDGIVLPQNTRKVSSW